MDVLESQHEEMAVMLDSLMNSPEINSVSYASIIICSG